jgi:hypothetical protein
VRELLGRKIDKYLELPVVVFDYRQRPEEAVPPENSICGSSRQKTDKKLGRSGPWWRAIGIASAVGFRADDVVFAFGARHLRWHGQSRPEKCDYAARV